MKEKNLMKKSLKRFLKRKVKITLGFVVAFMIMGNVGYCVDVVDENDGIYNYGNEWTKKLEENLILEKGYGIISENGTTKIISEDFSKDITINFDKYYKNSMVSAIISKGKSDLEIQANNMTLKNNYFDMAINTGIRVYNDSYSMKQDKPKADINLSGKLKIQDFKQGISVEQGGDLFLNTDSIEIIQNSKNENMKDGYGINIDYDDMGQKELTDVNITSNGDVDIINYWKGIVIGSNYSSLDLTSKEGNINIEFNKNFFNGIGEIGIEFNDISSKYNKFENKISGKNINIKNYNIGIENFNGMLNLAADNIINISEINDKGIHVEEKASKVLLDSNFNNIVSKNIGLHTKNGEITLTAKNENKILTLNNEDLSGTNYISAKNTAILSEDDGIVNLIGKNNEIISDDRGIEAKDGTVNINQNNENATGEKTFVSAVNEAVTAENGGKVNINSSSILIYGNGKADDGNTTLSNEASTQKENGNEDEGLKVYGAVYGYGGEINLTGDEITIHSVNKSHGEISDDNIREEYAGVLSRGGSTITLDGTSKIFSENYVALYATDIREEGSETFANSSGSKIILSDKGNHEIYGDIIAGKNSTIEINGSGNKISSGSSNENIEVMAGNNGKVDLDLTKGTLTGRIDDYQEAGEFGKGTFRNNKFYLDITESGEVNLDLTEGTWNALGQSFVTKISGENVTVNMSEEVGNSVHINSLEGNGTIIMYLDSDAVDNKDVKTDMLYISNVADGAEYTLQVADESKILNLENGEQLRFATIKGENKENVKFYLFNDDSNVKGRGIRNVEFKIVHDDYKNSDSDNENYNGSSEGMQKPGDEFVDKNFGEDSGDVGENYSFMKTGGQSDNEITHTIISMAKANYNSLVYMDNLNKRLGDMRFAEGTEGIWVRLRNDRVGEDDVYRLHNNMTQVGYDKLYNIKNGEGHRGIAFEYTRGDMDYKEFDGESNIDKYLISFYDTRLYNNGFYTDFIIKGGKTDSDFEIYAETNDGKTKVKGDYDNLFFGAGAEFGRRFDFDGNYYFEPQIQLQYIYIDDTDYTTNQNTKVEYSDINSLIGRAGFRIGKDFYKENSKDNTIYFKADINHEFLGEQDVEAMDMTGRINETYHNDKSWFDIGVGGAKNITEDLNVYFDIERQVGEAKDNSWQFNLGFRYSFDSAKDFSL